MSLVPDDSVLNDADIAEKDAFAIDIDGFEGPLHLLLDLARRQKVDLLHVSILELAQQYLAFIKHAQEKRIDLAADYLLMAAWLAWLKSRLLLPRPTDGDMVDASAIDDAPRLAFRLRRLNAMRKAGAALMNGAIVGRDVFLRGQPRQPAAVEIEVHDTNLWHLVNAVNAIHARQKQVAPHAVHAPRVLGLENARDNLRTLCRVLTEWIDFTNISGRVGGIDPAIPHRSVTASLFVAMLELVREGCADMRQNVPFGPLYLRGSPAAGKDGRA